MKEAKGPPSNQQRGQSIARLIEIMERLRDPVSGCEWDSVQTFATIAPYTIEEAYEVADAIARTDMDGLADELGDLQLQVVFHARMAEEVGHFRFEDVIERICDKMERRHPHIFRGAHGGGHHLWEQVKAEERACNDDQSALAGVALALPALERAVKLQRRAARTGFDWPDSQGARAKIHEELAELDAETEPARREEELGDLLFAVVNLARFLNIDPEEALRKANRKFEKRFRQIEQEPGFREMDLQGKERLWTAAKLAQAD
ncbi:MAG TPA: nucleoside triphosphate pyrophosphohydrolase [Sphingomicrobium sp.]|nr:nucleoside triphosphate pyrophosphohydrolase [Sphingomicrobium sp.]